MQTFHDLQLSLPLMRAIAEMGFEKPSPIQAQALPILLGEPTDFIGLAATGTGKTAAFGLPLLERINPHRRAVQALILCPTRELAIQVAGQIDLLGKYLGVKALPVYGGAGYHEQIRGLKQGANVVVGTPGRIVDHLDRGTLRLDEIKTVILDEADEMISMGFKEDMDKILGQVPDEDSNIWLFSATMSREVRRITEDYLTAPQQVEINRTEMLPENLEQIYYVTQESNKPEILCKLIDAADEFYGLVFCQTKSLVIDLTQYLTGRGYRADCLHGDMDQKARERTMQSFRDRNVTLLVCTDVASRGLDVKDVTHVINYSIPRELDSYVHRIGRTARSGKTGFAMSLVTPSNRGMVGRVERMTRSRMKEGKIPTRREIGVRKVAATLTKFQEQESFSRALELMDDSWKESLAAMSPEEVAGRFLTLLMPETFGEREARETRESSRPSPVAPLKKAALIVAPRGATKTSRAAAIVAPLTEDAVAVVSPVAPLSKASPHAPVAPLSLESIQDFGNREEKRRPQKAKAFEAGEKRYPSKGQPRRAEENRWSWSGRKASPSASPWRAKKKESGWVGKPQERSGSSVGSAKPWGRKKESLGGNRPMRRGDF